jgi:hypothetical protein
MTEILSSKLAGYCGGLNLRDASKAPEGRRNPKRFAQFNDHPEKHQFLECAQSSGAFAQSHHRV